VSPLTATAASAIAPNYAPLPVDIVSGDGAWVVDRSGVRYLDMLSAYSALNFGHLHPRLVRAAHEQLDRLTLTSRAFGAPILEEFCERLAALIGQEMVVPMNTGAEAVETAIKAARRWGYAVRGIQANTAEIIVLEGNFHGRTTTIVSFSTDDSTRADFGPFTPGFVAVPFGDAGALAAAVTPATVAVLIEPIQGEAGVRIPPAGYLRAVRQLCDDHNLLLIADEIQSGLGRTGHLLACDREGVRPDLVLLGKALGGGLLPVSAVVGSQAVLGLLGPGSHGSTFGGNPLACAVGLEVIEMLGEPDFLAASRRLGDLLENKLTAIQSSAIREVRCAGPWAAIDVDPTLATGREICEAALARHVLVKDTHGSTVRIAPPLVADRGDVAWGCDQLAAALDDLA
jgi:ornithine--oxo-acid transaminase